MKWNDEEFLFRSGIGLVDGSLASGLCGCASAADVVLKCFCSQN